MDWLDYFHSDDIADHLILLLKNIACRLGRIKTPIYHLMILLARRNLLVLFKSLQILLLRNRIQFILCAQIHLNTIEGFLLVDNWFAQILHCDTQVHIAWLQIIRCLIHLFGDLGYVCAEMWGDKIVNSLFFCSHNFDRMLTNLIQGCKDGFHLCDLLFLVINHKSVIHDLSINIFCFPEVFLCLNPCSIVHFCLPYLLHALLKFSLNLFT